MYTQAARETARKQAPEVREALDRSRAETRRTAAAYAAVTSRRARRAQLGRRLRNALRDAVLVGASIGVIWFIVTRTGVQIPVTAVLAVILVLMVVRFGYALFARTDTTVDEDNELEGGFGERWEREAGDEDREHDPRRSDPRAEEARRVREPRRR